MMTEQQSFDELALLGDDDDLGIDRQFTGDINEDELLGLGEHASQDDIKVPTNTQSNEETEQLDYEEDEEPKPREKFSSERKKETSAEETDSNQKAGNKCFVNPKFRNRLPNPPSSFNGAPLPSLLSQPIMPPQMMGPPPVDVSVRMLMMNSLRPIVQPMFRPMGPPPMGFPLQNQGFQPMGMPQNMMQNRPMGPSSGPITAQIGQLSTVIQQQNDGTITFRTKIPPTPQPRVTIARAGCSSESGQNKDWNSMVDDFIKAPSKSRKRDRRSRSISSRSYSNSSFSGSYSDESYSSASSRSPSPRHRRRRARSPSRKRSSYRRSSYRRSHRRERPRRSSPRRRRGSNDELKNTIECAEAVGVDQDYVRKLEEQKKLREEVARQKYQREGSSRNNDDSRRRRNDSSSRQRRNEEERPKIESKSSSKVADSNPDNKVKPYLVVVINNLSNLSDAYKRLKMIAQAVGKLKRAWQTSEDSVSIIFEQHEDAKNFMLQYHMKQFNGVTLSINLEKVFLNLAAIP